MYIAYTEANEITEHSFEVIMDFVPELANTEYLEMFSLELLTTAVIWQATKLWYVYAGLVVIMFLFVTSRQPNDYRGMEHGSAQWADKYNEKDFVDKTGIPIGDNFYATVKNPKGKYYSTHNLNETVIGGSGAGKSFRKIKPDIIQMYGSYVVIDPKGELYRDTAKVLRENGYRIRVLNLYDINNSHSYNPFVYMTNEQDVLDIADLFMKNSAGEGEKEDFWVGSAQDLLTAIMLYLWKSESDIKSFGRVVRLINSIRYDNSGKIDELCELARCMNKHKIEHGLNGGDAATVNWSSMLGTPQDTMGGIVKTLSSRLRLWAVTDIDEFTAEDEMDFDSIGTELTAIFVFVRPARNPYKAVVNMFYSQLFERLMWVANNKHNGRLPYLVSCEMDEFANCGTIPSFNETLAVVRSHNIRICIVLQGLSQLKAIYEKTWESIIGNCSIFTFLGTNDVDSNKYVSERLGKTTVRVETRSYNRGQQGGGSDSENLVARDLLSADEVPKAIRPKGKTKRFGGSCIVFVDEYRPFFKNKFDTIRHHLFEQVGSGYPKYIHNNTDITVEMAGLKEARSKRHAERNANLFDIMAEYKTLKAQENLASNEEIIDNMDDFAELDELTEEDIAAEIEAESEKTPEITDFC
jgi:type IV secretion system protein VirD4